MAENSQPDTSTAKPGASPGGGAAAYAALGAASRSKADAFLAEQTRLAQEQLRLTELQIENLRDQNAYEVSHLKWRHLNDLMKGVWQILLAAGGVLVAMLVAVVLWRASQAGGIVVDSLSVPPAHAAAGLTSEVLAGELTDAIGTIRDIGNASSLVRSADVRQERSDDVRVEIPETGVSIGQAWRYLRLWLGHERRLSGHLRDDGGGTLSLTVTLEGERAVTVKGPAAELPALEQQAAERVFESVDPNNYIIFLLAKGRLEECRAAAERYAQRPASQRSHANAVSLWAGMTRSCGGDLYQSLARARVAAALDPKLVTPHVELGSTSSLLGHDETVLREATLTPTLKAADQERSLQGSSFGTVLQFAAMQRALLLGDYAGVRFPACQGCPPPVLIEAEMAGRLHDAARGAALIEEAIASGPAPSDLVNQARHFTHAAAGDWPAAAADARALSQPPTVGIRPLGPDNSRIALPMLAYALARAGDVAQAEAVAGGLPNDCYECLRARGRIAAVKGDLAAADGWLARAIAFGPSLPFAYADRGEMLLRKGDVDGAIGQLTMANQKGPKFADALALWGEALTAKGKADLAVAKFEAAARLAPNWGRLHLKWGQALDKAGKSDLARAQFRAAAKLTLSAEERAELATQK